jgi:hypothetical protein
VPNQGIVELISGSGNLTSWVVGITVYYYDSGYKSLGTIAYNTTAKTENANQAAISANTYYILLDSTAKADVYGNGSKALYLQSFSNSSSGNYTYTGGSA